MQRRKYRAAVRPTAICNAMLRCHAAMPCNNSQSYTLPPPPPNPTTGRRASICNAMPCCDAIQLTFRNPIPSLPLHPVQTNGRRASICNAMPCCDAMQQSAMPCLHPLAIPNPPPALPPLLLHRRWRKSCKVHCQSKSNVIHMLASHRKLQLHRYALTFRLRWKQHNCNMADMQLRTKIIQITTILASLFCISRVGYRLVPSNSTRLNPHDIAVGTSKW